MENTPVRKLLSNQKLRQRLVREGGENAIAAVRAIAHPLADLEVAKRAKITHLAARAALNRLMWPSGVTSYEKAKDPKTGYDAYIWHVNIQKLKQLAKNP